MEGSLRADRDPARVFAAFKNPESPFERLQSLDAFFGNAAQALLADPLAEYFKKRPVQRSLSAMEEHESLLDDLLRRLPKIAELSGRDLLELTGADRRSRMGLWRSLQRKPKARHFREAVSDHLQRMILARAALDGAFQLLLAESSLHLLVPWQTCRRAFLAALTQSQRERVDVEGARKWWIDAAARHEQRAALLLARYDAWAGSISAWHRRRLASEPPAGFRWRSAPNGRRNIRSTSASGRVSSAPCGR